MADFDTPFVTYYNTISTLDLTKASDEAKCKLARKTLEWSLEYIGEMQEVTSGCVDKWSVPYHDDYESKPDLTDKDVLEEVDVNQRIKDLITNNPVPMVDYPDTLPEEEEEAAKRCIKETITNAHGDVFGALDFIHTVAKSYRYAYLLVPYIEKCIEEYSFYTRNLDDRVLDPLMRLNFHNLKACCREPSERYIQAIEHNTIGIRKFISGADTITKILDEKVPFWRDVEGINITGSLISHLLTDNYPCDYSSVSAIHCDLPANKHKYSSDHFYAPTYFDLSPFTNIIGYVMKGYYCVLVDATCLYFPTWDGKVVTFNISDDYVEEFDSLETPKANVKVSYMRRIDVPDKDGNFVKDDGSNKISETCVVDIVPGTDVDIAVFDPDQLDRVANEIYEYLQAPGVELKKVNKSNGYNYTISMSPVIPEGVNIKSYIKKYLTFTSVEVYATTSAHVFSHHVNATRGYMTVRDGTPIFRIDPSLAYTLLSYTRSITNYHYFAGKKSSPLDVIARYVYRRFRAPSYITQDLYVYTSLCQYKGTIPHGMTQKEADDIF